MHADLERLAGRPVIIGGGLAGLMAALELAPVPVVVVTRAPLGKNCASAWSQGGLAAAVGPDDSPALHLADTLAAGDGLCDEAAARRIIEAGPGVVERLTSLGARFSRDAAGGFKLKLEAAHCRRRVLNAGGDGTGAEIMRAVVEAVRGTPSITVLEGVTALDLAIGDGVEGIVLACDGEAATLPSRAVVLASGGVGSLWLHTTNPPDALGHGLAMAARAGAELVDLEFVQFHPTALDVGLDPMPLASEALRGDGAVLVDETGARFMAGQGRAELEPRDIVARAVWRHLAAGHRVFLDTRGSLGATLPERFPFIAAACRAAGIDPVASPFPIRPAAHYHMGGIAVDRCGRTGLAGLWACGEAAATGLHGANRLASNSLLEAAVTGMAVAHDLAGLTLGPARPPDAGAEAGKRQAMNAELGGLGTIREIMSADLGVLRDRAGLERALAALLPLTRRSTGAPAPAPAGAALLIAASAWLRRESRGGHCRTDFPVPQSGTAQRHKLTLAQALRLAEELAGGR
jgi:L-aspartate oxidase